MHNNPLLNIGRSKYFFGPPFLREGRQQNVFSLFAIALEQELFLWLISYERVLAVAGQHSFFFSFRNRASPRQSAAEPSTYFLS